MLNSLLSFANIHSAQIQSALPESDSMTYLQDTNLAMPYRPLNPLLQTAKTDLERRLRRSSRFTSLILGKVLAISSCSGSRNSRRSSHRRRDRRVDVEHWTIPVCLCHHVSIFTFDKEGTYWCDRLDHMHHIDVYSCQVLHRSRVCFALRTSFWPIASLDSF